VAAAATATATTATPAATGMCPTFHSQQTAAATATPTATATKTCFDILNKPLLGWLAFGQV